MKRLWIPPNSPRSSARTLIRFQSKLSSPTIFRHPRSNFFAQSPGGRSTRRSGRSPADLANDLADADALLVRSATKVTADLLKARRACASSDVPAPASTTSTSPAASARGVLVVNAPGANSISVAELACALMLSLARPIPAADRAMKDGKWEKKRFLGTEVRGKTLGIAGLGRIGQEVARARARVRHAHRRPRSVHLAGNRRPARASSCSRFDELCASADFLTLHLPSTPETKSPDRTIARFAKSQAAASASSTRRAVS